MSKFGGHGPLVPLNPPRGRTGEGRRGDMVEAKEKREGTGWKREEGKGERKRNLTDGRREGGKV